MARTSFWVPGIRGLNMFFSDRAYPATPFSVRVSRDYFTLCVSAVEDSLNIPARSKTELISKIFELWGIHAEMSQPGVVATRLIEQMGDLERCGAFRFPGVSIFSDIDGVQQLEGITFVDSELSVFTIRHEQLIEVAHVNHALWCGSACNAVYVPARKRVYDFDSVVAERSPNNALALRVKREMIDSSSNIRHRNFLDQE